MRVPRTRTAADGTDSDEHTDDAGDPECADSGGAPSTATGRHSRRAFLATAAAVGGTLALAGCSEITDQEFTADRVVLPEDAREELVLSEVASESRTVSRTPSAGGVEGEVSVTSHAVAYHRGPARGTPTATEAFLSGVNGTEGAGPAKVMSASAAGVEEVRPDPGRLPFDVDSSPFLPGDSVGLVVPAGARDGESVDPTRTLALISGRTWADRHGPMRVPDRHGPMRIPSTTWMPDRHGPLKEEIPPSLWIPSTTWVPEDPGSIGVVVETGEQSLEEVVGVSAEAVDAEPVESGAEFDPESTMIAHRPGRTWADRHGPMRAETVFGAGFPAPLGGATFGMGVLSTPTAEVGGEIQNPFASEDLGTLLGGNRARMLLQQAGLDRAGEFEWLAGPEEATAERVAETLGNEGTQVPKTWPEFDSLSVLGADAEVKSFAGVIGGGEGPTAVGIHVARVRSDGNTVIAAGVHRTPAGSAKSTGYPVPRPDYYPDARPDSYPVPRPDYFRSRALAGETAGRVVYADEPE
ncbi:DUF6517 family protein [Salinirussus salinus]|uniref:DUF6517 family protein n=1 Tax=Salinirussus salinus TaxID=1198300 RepID=UPI00135B6E61|nr:DUF6517 family protein [Salinirussus salinus]